MTCESPTHVPRFKELCTELARVCTEALVCRDVLCRDTDILSHVLHHVSNVQCCRRDDHLDRRREFTTVVVDLYELFNALACAIELPVTADKIPVWHAASSPC